MSLGANKMWSGRFILCICAAIAMVVISCTLAVLLVLTRTDDTANPMIMSALTAMSGLLSSVVTFYFTKPQPPQEQK